GTSGQKVPINGGINVSILDGWWVEGYRGDNGWAIGDDQADPDNVVQDLRDAESLYNVLEQEVVPRFYERDDKDLPRPWIATMKNSIESVVAPFSAHRMVRDYVNSSSLPASTRRE
ncbi:MAG TPA: alpha-glucan phosphorylase, partial [Vicinamibacteria bacterium]